MSYTTKWIHLGAHPHQYDWIEWSEAGDTAPRLLACAIHDGRAAVVSFLKTNCIPYDEAVRLVEQVPPGSRNVAFTYMSDDVSRAIRMAKRAVLMDRGG